MAEKDKVTRILIMYTELLEGKKIYKKSFCTDTGINRRTFDRDIEDIRLYFSESYIGYDLIYDRSDESYYLDNYHREIPLSAMEVSFLIALVKSSQILRKDEYMQLAYNIIHTCVWNKQEVLSEIFRKEINAYPQDVKKEALLKMQWDLQQCISERDIIRVTMLERYQKIISPLSLWISRGELYLIGCGMEEKLEVIPVRKIVSFKIEQKKFSRELEERFKYTDWQAVIVAKEKERMEDGTSEKED
ncbi:hypothetical protein H6A65_16405 [Mediterraneibacter glycyrrhizinilyticus]|uniref:hypothetical protein n=1 Tax=Mediterraneibacter glycyrrhizinilyticus TaxID=342942 RepID=UPI00195F96A6|nr:hypothetical protein [Mediterraneibacter glycyrrhizinilyticus]MBM6753043.1 hypothetical protein [Mediterraneibacter glycyrrhizinilyticus]